MLSSLSPAKITSVFPIFYLAAADIKKVLGEVEATTSDDDINRVIESLKGKKVHELIAQGVSGIGAPSGPATSGAVVKE